MSAAITTWTGTPLSAQEHANIVRGTNGINETYHIAVTYSGAVSDRANGGGDLFLEEAQAKMQDIRKHTPDTRLTVFRITVEVVHP